MENWGELGTRTPLRHPNVFGGGGPSTPPSTHGCRLACKGKLRQGWGTHHHPRAPLNFGGRDTSPPPPPIPIDEDLERAGGEPVTGGPSPITPEFVPPPPEATGKDIIPVYCSLLAAVVVGLLAYVAFKW